jgi:DNA-binding NtrC family response regulator
MTTALIGKVGTEVVRARVALVSRHAGTLLPTLLAGTAHEGVEFPDWATFRTASIGTSFDLLLCDDEAIGSAPRDAAMQLVLVGERRSDAMPEIPAVPATALETCLDALLALAVALRQCGSKCRELERVVDGIRSGNALVGHSPVMRRLLTAISRAADSDATVLIEGPVGAGKSLTARMIHCKSRRTGRPITVVECASATADSLAKALAEANGTTVVLENVDQLPPPAQATLVRNLKERPGVPNSAARIVSTTSAHLPELVARGTFREDLYYRLHGMPITVPALRERVSDLSMLAQAILAAGTQDAQRPINLTNEAVSWLESMPWPGNVAQLETVLRRAQLLAGGNPIGRDHLAAAPVQGNVPVSRESTPRDVEEPDDTVAEEQILPFEVEEQRMLTRALSATKGNVRRAAQLLGIGRATLYRKIQQYQLRLQ